MKLEKYSKVQKYTAEISEKLEHDEWNEFLADAEHFGHHEQTTCWAAIERPKGWKAVRIIVRREGSIVGGVSCSFSVRKFSGTLYICAGGPILRTMIQKLKTLDLGASLLG